MRPYPHFTQGFSCTELMVATVQGCRDTVNGVRRNNRADSILPFFLKAGPKVNLDEMAATRSAVKRQSRVKLLDLTLIFD